MADAAILYFHDNWTWRIPPSWLPVSWALYQIWFKYLVYNRLQETRPTFVPDIRLITSCELTSGSVFGRSYLRVVVLHLCTKLCAKNSNTYNLNSTKPTMTTFLQGIATTTDKSKMVDGGHIEFRKMLLSRTGWRHLTLSEQTSHDIIQR